MDTALSCSERSTDKKQKMKVARHLILLPVTNKLFSDSIHLSKGLMNKSEEGRR